MVLEKENLLSIVGGAYSKKISLGIIAAAFGSFIIGIIDGYLRPLACNK